MFRQGPDLAGSVINWSPGSGSVIQEYGSADSDKILQIFAHSGMVRTSITTITYINVKRYLPELVPPHCYLLGR
jgi:hypothetical protein